MVRNFFQTFVISPARSSVPLLLCCAAVFLLMSMSITTATAETFQIDLGREGKHHATHTLSPGSNNTYHVSAESPGGLGCVVNLTGNGTFKIFFLLGHTKNSSGYLEDYSSAKNTTKYAKSYYVGNDDDEKVTIMIVAEEDSNVTYGIWLASWDLSDLVWGSTEVHSWFLIGMGVVGVIGVAGALWVYWRLPKHRKSFRSVRFSPWDLIQFFHGAPQEYESRIKAQGSFVSKQKYVTQRGNGTALCPFCKKNLGAEGEGYLFNVINFIDERPIPDQDGRIVKRVWGAVAVYCQNCEMIIGITR